MFRILFISTVILNLLYADNLEDSLKQKNLSIQEIEFKKEFLEKVELSLEVAKDKEYEDKYELKLYPKSQKEQKLEIDIFNLQKQKSNILHQELQNERLKQLYILMLDCNYQKNLVDNLSIQIDLNQKILEIQTKRVENISNTFDVIKQKEKLELQKIELLEQENRYKNYLKRIDTKNKIELENLKQKLYTDSKKVSKERIDVEIAKLNQELTTLKNSAGLDNLALKYENQKDFNRAFSLNLVFEINMQNSTQNLDDRLRVLQSELKLIETKEKESLENQSLIDEITILETKLKNYKNYLNKDEFYKNYTAMQSPDTLIVLNLQYKKSELESEILKIEYELYKKIIELLYINRMFSY